MSAAYFRLLFDYNRWANAQVLAPAAAVGEAEYFATVPGLSFGSLHATLVHILVSEVVWLARWQGGKPPEALKDARQADRVAATVLPSFTAVTTLWQGEVEKQARFFTDLTDAQAATSLHYENQYGEPNVQPVEQLIGHLVNHGTQFRAETAVRLTQLGRSPGDLDLIIYLRRKAAGTL